MQDFYRAEAGKEEEVKQQAKKACAKLIKDLFYEACVQAIKDYYAKILGDKIDKYEARKIHLTKDQYMRVNVDNNTNLI